MREGAVLAAGPLTELSGRPDLPLGLRDDAGVVLHGQVLEHDPAHGMSCIDVRGTRLWVGSVDAPPGAPVRARLLARDVSVTRQRPQETSILNVVPVTLDDIVREPSAVWLRLRAAGEDWVLLARITSRSLDALVLRPGDALYAQIKGVALMPALPGPAA